MEPRPDKAPGRIGIIIAYFLIYVVWGSTYFFIGVALRDFPPFLLGALRFTLAGLLLLAWSLWRGEPVFKKTVIRTAAVSGVILLFIDMAVIMLAEAYITSSLVSIIASSTAVWIVAFDIKGWKTNFRDSRVSIGILSGFIGVSLLFAEQYEEPASGDNNLYGIGILLLGCISWALGTLYTKYKSSEKLQGAAFSGAAWQMLSASFMFWIVMSFLGEWAAFRLAQVSLVSGFSLLYLVVFGSLLAYTAYIWLLKVRPASEVATHAYVNPVIAIIIGMTLGGEKVTWVQVTGLVIILMSVALVQIKKKKK